jgi:hypothetical protein
MKKIIAIISLLCILALVVGCTQQVEFETTEDVTADTDNEADELTQEVEDVDLEGLEEAEDEDFGDLI